MDVVGLIALFAGHSELAVLVTDGDPGPSGPTILYANPAFSRMSGYAADEVVGGSPRLLQGSGTNRLVAASVARDLRADGRFHGVLENYRKSGDPYLCEIDVRPVTGPDHRPIAFIAFEREVFRRRGRPSRDRVGRYRPIATAAMETPPIGGGPQLFA